MKDMAGNKLTEGCKVFVIVPYYRNLIKATVVKVTPKGATVKYYHKGRFVTTSRQSDQIVLNQKERIEQLENKIDDLKFSLDNLGY